MFDLSKEPILSSSTRLATLALAALVSAVIGACWNGDAADGLPCDDDKQCGAGTKCIDGFCGGGGGAGANVNQCEGEDGNLAYRLGPTAVGSDNALKVVAVDIQGSESPDVIVAGQSGDYVRIQFDLGSMDPKEHFLDSPPPSFDGRRVFDFDVGEVNGDDRDDVVVVTTGANEVVAYVYQNMKPMPPEQFGAEVVVPDALGVTLRGVELGRLDNDTSIDMVAVVDNALFNGVLMVSLGDSTAATSGQPYFSPQVFEGAAIGYDMFTDMAVADVDGDGLDDVLVTGSRNSMPALWFIRRNDGDAFDSWDAPIDLPLMAPGSIALGRFTGSPPPGEPNGPRPDVAIFTSMTGLIQPFVNMGGMLMPGMETTLEGVGFTDLTISDMNCDGQGDFVYGLTQPPEIRVLLGDGMGGAGSTDPLAYADQGTPRGGLDVALFDDDAAPDIFTAADPGDGQMGPQVRVLVTGEE